MFKLSVVAVLVMSSQFAMAKQVEARTPESISVERLIELAKDQGLSVAQCRYGLCRDTEDGYYVNIENSGRDGYYAYDPLDTTPSEGFDPNMADN